jgi:RecB family exonuclease
MSQHSTLIGGSTAYRLLACPGSYQALLDLPELPETISPAAEEGTFAHAVMDSLMNARMADSSTDLKAEARLWLGDIFYDRKLTQEHLDLLIYPAIDAVAELEAEYGGGFKVAGVEVKCNFPDVPGAYGTVDLILQSPTHVLVIDYKFGLVEVSVEVEQKLNPQLAYYACAAAGTHPKWFANKREIVVAIIQPRGQEVLSHTTVARAELELFVEDVTHVVAKALTRNPPLRRGPHCGYCPAKIACPEWVGPIKQLAALGKKPDPRIEAVTRMPSAYGQYLAHCKALVDDLHDFAKEVDAQLKAYLEDGGYVEGWQLAPKKKQRQWVDPAVVVPELIKLGFKDNEIWQHTLQTFAVADAAAKSRGKKIPNHLRVVPETDETVVVKSADGQKAIDRPLLIEQLAATAAKLSREG